MTRMTFKTKTLAAALAAAFCGSAAFALPAGLGATQGMAGVVTAGPVMTVTTQAGKSVANWQSFNIGAGEKVIINQPNSSSAMLNRVTGADPSTIFGRLQSNGAVWLVNPAGIMVGPGGRVDTAAFVASTLSVTNTDFLAGRMNFGGNAAAKLAGRITNDGEIRAPAGGSILIVAPQIENNGVMTSPGGEIILAAGHSVQVLNTGTPGVVVEVKADRGELNLSQMVASGKVFARNSGTVSASNVVAEGGRVFLRASPVDGGVAVNTGTLEAEGAPGKGGFIDTSGSEVEVTRGQIKVGSGGTWLLDPTDVLIDSGFAHTISDVLDTGGNVSISTYSASSDAGDIIIKGSIYATGFNSSLNPGSLTLTANRDVVIDGGQSGVINLYLSTVSIIAGGKVTEVVGGGRNGAISARLLSIDAGGDVNLSHPQNSISNWVAIKTPGAISLNARGDVSLGFVSGFSGLTSGGNITIKAQGIHDRWNSVIAPGIVSLTATSGNVDLGDSPHQIKQAAITATGKITLKTTADLTLVGDAGSNHGLTSTGGQNITVTAKSITDTAGNGIDTIGNVSVTTTNGDVSLTGGASKLTKAAITSYSDISLTTTDDLVLSDTGTRLVTNNNGNISITAKSLTENPGSGIVTDGIVSITTTGGDVVLTTGASHIKQAAITSYGNILLGTMEDLQLVSFGGNAGLKSLNKGDILVEAKSIKDSPGNGIFTEGKFAVQTLNDTLLDHSSINSLYWAESFNGNIHINNQGGRALELTGGVGTHRSSSSVFIGNEGDLILKPGSLLGTDGGSEFVLAATGDFKNESGSANPLYLPNGRWLVYSANPADIVKGGMVSNFRQYDTPIGTPVAGAGNGFLYASAKPTVEIDVRNKLGSTSHIYGEAPNLLVFPDIKVIGSADNEDDARNFGLNGTFRYDWSPAAPTARSVPGTYHVRYTGDLASNLGFSTSAGPGFDYTVIPTQAWSDAHRPVRPAVGNTAAESALLRASALWSDTGNWPLPETPCVPGAALPPPKGSVVIGSPKRSGSCG